MKEETLKMIGRKATAAQTFSLVVLSALPASTVNSCTEEKSKSPFSFVKSLSNSFADAPDSLTAHSLAVKRASKLSQWIQVNGIKMLNNTEETLLKKAPSSSLSSHRSARCTGLHPSHSRTVRSVRLHTFDIIYDE